METKTVIVSQIPQNQDLLQLNVNCQKQQIKLLNRLKVIFT